MTLNPPSFRLPFNLPEDMDPEVRRAIEFTFNGLLNHEQAFRALKTGTTVTNTTIIQSGGGGGGGGVSGVGGVNDQRGVTAYTTQQSDDGVKIIFADASAITLTLNAGVTTPWFTFIDNDSSGTVSFSPTAGPVIGEQNIPPYGFGLVFFDGANWFCGAVRLASPTISGYCRPDSLTIFVDSTTGQLNVPIAADGVLGLVKPDGITIGVDSTFEHTLGPSGTIPLGPLTPGGTTGHITVFGGLISGWISPT